MFNYCKNKERLMFSYRSKNVINFYFFIYKQKKRTFAQS